MTPDLTTRLGDLVLPSPVMTAAGCGGTGRELTPYTDLTALGAFTTRTITLDADPGAPAPRLVDTPSGVLTAHGMHNPGLQGFLATELPWLAQRQVRTVVSIAGASLAEYGELARRVGASPGVAAVEVNLVPGSNFGEDPYQAGKVLHVVRRDVPRGRSVFAKIGPAAGYLDLARATVNNGADALVVAHGFPGLGFDPHTLRPALGAVTGEVSGPAVLAQALRCVWEVHAALPGIPVIGVGGVRTGFDAVQMLLAGATAVQVGTVLLRDPAAADRVTDELRDELARRELTGAAELVGRGHVELSHQETP